MIRKVLLIKDSGLLPFFISQDNIEIDKDLLSGFCSALYDISIELKFPLKTVGFEENKMIVESIEHWNKNRILIAMLFDEYHIDEAIKNKIRYVYEKFFLSEEFGDQTRRLNNEQLDNAVLNIVNDIPLRIFLRKNLNAIQEILDPILLEKDNDIFAYALTSSNNSIIYCNGTYELTKNRPGEIIEDIIKDFLVLMKFEKIPHGDKFLGMDMSDGLDLKDFLNSGQKTLGIVINTSINLKEEPNNELLLYFFGKNMLMRSCVPNIEEQLRNRLSHQT
jgi:hypothetical protein